MIRVGQNSIFNSIRNKTFVDGIKETVQLCLMGRKVMGIDDPNLGHITGTDYFWGDIAQKHINYVRNFVYKEINTYKINPSMPYHNP